MTHLPQATPIKLAAALAALAALLPAPAAAQFSWQALGTLTSGVTNDAVPGAEGDGADSYTEVSPSLRLGLRSGRALHQLQYTFAATLYVDNFDQATSYSNQVALISAIQASDNLRLGFGLVGTQGQQNAQAAAEGGVQAPGATRFVQLGANQGLGWQLGPRWALSQTLEGQFYRELFDDQAGFPPQPDVFSVQLTTGLSRSFERLRLGGRVLGTYNANLEYTDTISAPATVPRCEPLAGGGCLVPTEHLQSVELRAEGSLEISRAFSLEAHAGMLESSVSRAWGELYLQPTAGGVLRYAGPRATALLSFEHTFLPSLRLGETFRYERVRLEGRVPIGPAFRERWFAIASAGYDFAQAVDPAANELGDSAHVYVAQAGVQWLINDNITGLARYELSGQTKLGDLPAFTRHAVLVGVEVRYPGSRQPTQALRPGRVAPHQMSQQRWDEMFQAAPGQARPTPAPGASGQPGR